MRVLRQVFKEHTIVIYPQGQRARFEVWDGDALVHSGTQSCADNAALTARTLINVHTADIPQAHPMAGLLAAKRGDPVPKTSPVSRIA